MATDDDWTKAEATLRANLAARGLEILELTAKRDATLGIAFWVRYVAGGGGLVVVRGDEVLSEPLPASVDRLIELDGWAAHATVSATDFLYLVQTWNALPAIGNPVRDHATAALNPRWTKQRGGATFVVHAARQRAGGARATKTFPARRATGTLGPTGLSWVLDDVDVPLA